MRSRALLLAAIVLLTFLAAPFAGAQIGPAPYEARVDFVRGEARLAAVSSEVADEASEWSSGLMGRAPLPDDTGMLFVFPVDTMVSFWMRNTPSPLSIAFIRGDGRVVSIQDMEPLSEQVHSPPEPIRSALEVPQGYFGRRGVRVGDMAQIWRVRARLPLLAR